MARIRVLLPVVLFAAALVVLSVFLLCANDNRDTQRHEDLALVQKYWRSWASQKATGPSATEVQHVVRILRTYALTKSEVLQLLGNPYADGDVEARNAWSYLLSDSNAMTVLFGPEGTIVDVRAEGFTASSRNVFLQNQAVKLLGKTRAEIESLIGKPDRMENDGRVWLYKSLNDTAVKVHYGSDGTVVKFERPEGGDANLPPDIASASEAFKTQDGVSRAPYADVLAPHLKAGMSREEIETLLGPGDQGSTEDRSSWSTGLSTAISVYYDEEGKAIQVEGVGMEELYASGVERT